jgi:lipoyl(octanoyl) transferase
MVQHRAPTTDPSLALQAYLLGEVSFDDALILERKLVYSVSGDRSQAVIVLCEHPPIITVGREGSRADIDIDPQELTARRWGVRWVNRGGGCLLQLPGQLAIYPILPLDRLGLGVQSYLDRLGQVLLDVLNDFSVEARLEGGRIRVGSREIAHLGAAVRDWVTYYGAVLNVHPDLALFRRVRTGPGEEPMTSLERERRGPLRTAMVRERFLEHFAARFGFVRTSLFFQHPSLGTRPAPGAVLDKRGEG